MANSLETHTHSPQYVSTYCNFPHRCIDGKPIEHCCRVIPPKALQAERDLDFELACEIMGKVKLRTMRRGVAPCDCRACREGRIAWSEFDRS